MMTKLSEANQVYYYVFLELLSILCRDVEGVHDSWHALCVYVEDWGIDGFCDICAVVAGSLSVRSCSEPNLIIYYDVNCTSDFIVSQRLHL